ncbi:MAG: DUF4432 family protein [Ruminococcaceae bacterium]|nr:DUF4432 family protein [Oscillospiraceae bacterium]
MQVASLRRYTLTEGKENGIEVIDCDNGKLRFLLNVSKACDVMQMYHAGENLSFISKNGFEKRELAFSRRFEGGMVYTCGLDNVGGRKGFEPHGTLHNIPAEIVRAELTDKEIVVEAIVRDTNLAVKNLVLRRKITSLVGTSCVTIEDTLTNEGFSLENYALLYHVNIGYPMLDEGARIVADIAFCEPRTPHAESEWKTRYAVEEPTVGAEECCYFLKFNKPEIALENAKNGKRFVLSYSGDTLPCFVEWKSAASGLYVVGFEPATTRA